MPSKVAEWFDWTNNGISNSSPKFINFDKAVQQVILSNKALVVGDTSLLAQLIWEELTSLGLRPATEISQDFLMERIANLLRSKAHSLVRGDIDTTSRMIVAQLAHVHHCVLA